MSRRMAPPAARRPAQLTTPSQNKNRTAMFSRTSFSRDRFFKIVSAAAVALVLGVLALASPTPAMAEGKIRISQQYGIVYLLLNVVQDQHLIEKHGKAAGVDIKVEWLQLSGGSAVNEALLSGAIDIASAGIGPLLTIWDRTYGKQDIRGVASLGNFPIYLISNRPDVHTIADLGQKDRIALPAVGVSVQSRFLQLASAQLWGNAQYNKLDAISVTLPHPDATAAIISGGTEITAHFANPPFQEQELAANPKAHIVLDSYKVMGGPASSTVLFSTGKFRKENPKTYKAFQDALAEAAQFIKDHPEEAADIYQRVSNSKQDKALLLQIIKNPLVQFQIAPQNTYKLARFMFTVGAIKNEPKSWRDYFFDDAATAQGS
jgi:NitT/TauT family transport system substrate-binding protein